MNRRMHLTLILTTYTLSSHFTPHLTSHTQDPFFDTFIHFSFSSISAKTLLFLPIAHFGRPNTHKNSSPTSLYSFLHFHLIFHLLPFHFLSFLPTHPHKSKTLATFLHLPPSSRPNHLPPWISTQTFTFSSSPCVAKAPHLFLQRKCACRFNIWPHVLVLVLCRFQTIFIFCLVNSLIKTH